MTQEEEHFNEWVRKKAGIDLSEIKLIPPDGLIGAGVLIKAMWAINKEGVYEIINYKDHIDVWRDADCISFDNSGEKNSETETLKAALKYV